MRMSYNRLTVMNLRVELLKNVMREVIVMIWLPDVKITQLFVHDDHHVVSHVTSMDVHHFANYDVEMVW